MITLFRMAGARGGGKKPSHPNSFFLVTSNVAISPQNFLTFSFNPFDTLV